jgi:PPM family protein phosphatase
MGLLTIGAFARASRLSPKALRLYDDLGLLQPAEVDPASGYRFYDPAQLDRARLVAWLRRLGMPLARIRLVCDAEPATAAAEIAAYWAQVTIEAEARQELAAFLVDYLQGKATAMTNARSTLGIRFAAKTDIGQERARNEDCAHAGAHVLAVADGLGGHAGGAKASAAAISVVAALESSAAGSGDPLVELRHTVQQASADIRALAESDPSLAGLGTTLTAMLWSGSQLALVHIGDSRAYLLRGGELFQLTEDHTYVQSLVKAGKIGSDEAATHPERQLLERALEATSDPEADLSLHAVESGDRYLLCTDGLHGVVATAQIQSALSASADPETAVRELIGLANAAGGPDNIACVVADVIHI